MIRNAVGSAAEGKVFMPNKKLSITLEQEFYEVIKDMAEKDRRSVSSMIGLMLKRYMREYPDGYPEYPETYPRYSAAKQYSAAAEKTE